MSRKPDTPCADCGTLLWSGKGSRPSGARVCRSCRAVRRAASLACDGCGEAFVPAQEGQRFCSLACWHESERLTPVEVEQRRARERERLRGKNRRRRAAKRGAASELYTIADIARRDRYRCQLCRRPVDMSVPWPRPSSPTIDHVLPLADGGDDTRANVQLAHLGCNSGKGARGSQQLALVG